MRASLKGAIVALALLVSGVLVSPSAQSVVKRGWATAYNLTVQNVARFADGTAAVPSISFTSTPDSGWYWSPSFGLSASIGGVRQLSIANGQVIATGALTTGAVAVASLPTCNAGNIAARHFVTDSNAALTAGIGAIVAAGGSNNVPVVCDGTNWRIG